MRSSIARRSSIADGTCANRSWTGRGVAAVMVSRKSSAASLCVPTSSAAERPSLVSEARRNAKRFDSAAAGRWMLRSSSPGCSTLTWLPVTKSTAGTSRGGALRGHSV